MDAFKGFFSSKTVWAGMTTVVASVLGLYGYHVSADDQVTITDLITQTVTLVGGAVAIYGRVTATKQIGAKK